MQLNPPDTYSKSPQCISMEMRQCSWSLRALSCWCDEHPHLWSCLWIWWCEKYFCRHISSNVLLEPLEHVLWLFMDVLFWSEFVRCVWLRDVLDLLRVGHTSFLASSTSPAKGYNVGKWKWNIRRTTYHSMLSSASSSLQPICLCLYLSLSMLCVIHGGGKAQKNAKSINKKILKMFIIKLTAYEILNEST